MDLLILNGDPNVTIFTKKKLIEEAGFDGATLDKVMGNPLYINGRICKDTIKVKNGDIVSFRDNNNNELRYSIKLIGGTPASAAPEQKIPKNIRTANNTTKSKSKK